MSHKDVIPGTWKRVKIGDVTTLNPRIPDKESLMDNLEVQFVPMKLVEEEIGKIHLSEFRKFSEVQKSYTSFINGDVLFAKVTPCMENGKIAVADNLKNGIGYGSSEFHVLRPSEKINPHYLFHYIVQNNFRKIAQTQMTGAVGLRRVPKQFLENSQIPLPPIGEQQLIVSKLEELFSELDKGKQQLETALQQLKIYRQAVLKWAFEGKLTNKNVKDGELPNGWRRASLNKLCIVKRGASKHRPRNAPELYGGEYPLIQTGDIRNAAGGYIKEWHQTYNDVGLKQSRLWPKGTLCITIAANIGDTAILDFDACFPDSVVGLICDQKHIETKYANYFFISHKHQLEKLAPATAQKNINVDILEKVQVPLPSIDEQHLIIQEIESRLSVCDKMEETITNSLKQAETLRQSILKKAFEGKLV